MRGFDESAASGSDPGLHPAAGDDAEKDEGEQGEGGVGDEAGGVGASALPDWPWRLGRMPPPSAPISPIMPPAMAVVTGQRRGTSWKVAPLPAPRAAKQSMKSSVVTRSDGDAMRPKRPAMAMRKTTERVVMPPMRSANQPPRTRVALPVRVARTVRLPAWILVTWNCLTKNEGRKVARPMKPPKVMM